MSRKRTKTKEFLIDSSIDSEAGTITYNIDFKVNIFSQEL